jgi:hypothetical protein
LCDVFIVSFPGDLFADRFSFQYDNDNQTITGMPIAIEANAIRNTKAKAMSLLILSQNL